MKTRRTASGSRLLIALAAMLAVLVQALLPAAAMAHDVRDGGSAIVICTADGAKLVKLGGKEAPAKGFAGFSCSRCVAASLAAVTPDPEPTVAPVLYAVYLQRAPLRAPSVRGHARAPPRPPGQGPPQHLNA